MPQRGAFRKWEETDVERNLSAMLAAELHHIYRSQHFGGVERHRRGPAIRHEGPGSEVKEMNGGFRQVAGGDVTLALRVEDDGTGCLFQPLG